MPEVDDGKSVKVVGVDGAALDLQAQASCGGGERCCGTTPRPTDPPCCSIALHGEVDSRQSTGDDPWLRQESNRGGQRANLASSQRVFQYI